MNGNIFYGSWVILFILVVNSQLTLSSTAILCRSCGYDVSSSDDIFSKPSSKSHKSFNDTLFSKDEVLVGIFVTDVFFHYPVITFHHSTCVGVGEWEEVTSWSPGYRWKPCICPECGSFIGWVFEPINPVLVEPPKTFYGLILDSLISETCKYDMSI